MKNYTESITIANAFREWCYTHLPRSREMSIHSQRAYKDALSLYVTYLNDVVKIKAESLSINSFTASFILFKKLSELSRHQRYPLYCL